MADSDLGKALEALRLCVPESQVCEALRAIWAKKALQDRRSLLKIRLFGQKHNVPIVQSILVRVIFLELHCRQSLFSIRDGVL